jgi:hypothetical protein
MPGFLSYHFQSCKLSFGLSGSRKINKTINRKEKKKIPVPGDKETTKL